MRVAVAGGGIAGLTAAIALAARGIDVEIFERAPEMQEVGAGIQLAPNAMRLIERLGVAIDGLVEPRALVLRDASSGATLTQLPLGPAARERYGAPYCTLHRADLQAGLLRAAQSSGRIALHLGTAVERARSEPDAITVRAGEDERRFDALVAADGIASRLRTEFFGHSGPRAAGRTAWRGTLPAAAAPCAAPRDLTVLWLGRGAHIVHYPIRGGDELNVVVVAGDEGPRPPLARFGPEARRILESVGGWTPWPLHDLPTGASWPAGASWVRGRAALTGDAAHAMLPSAAQGGAQAIEDAYVLASCLARSDVEAALKRYERLRRPRVARVMRESRRNLRVYELGGPAAFARDAALRVLPARLLLQKFDWLFGWRPA